MRRDGKKNKEGEVGRERRRRESMLIYRELRRTDRQNVCTSSRENLGFDYHNAIFSIIRGFVFLRFNPVRCPLQGSVPYLYRGGFASGGLELVSYFTFDKLRNSEKVAFLKPWNGSIKEMIGNEPYLAFALLFICMKTFICFFPAISSCMKDFFVPNVWRLKLGIFGEWNHLFEQALDIVDIKKLCRQIRFCDKSKNLHNVAKSAQVLASSLASVSLGESPSSSRLDPCFQD